MSTQRRGTITRGALSGVVLLVLGAAVAFGQPAGADPWGGRGQRPDPDRAILTDAYAKVTSQLGDRRLGEVKLSELEKLLGTLSIARQEWAYVKRSEAASYFFPGAGQYLNGAPGTGTLFLAGNLAVIAGTIVGAYFLLPSDLHLDRLNWFTAPFSTVKSSFEGHSFVDYLPTLGVLLGGVVVDQILRVASASNAGGLARERVRDGTVTFRPEPLILPPVWGRGPWSYGVGMGLWF